MLSRLMWIGIAGLALIVGMVVQDGDRVFGWVKDTEISAKAEGAIEDRVAHAIDRSFDKMQVTGSDGQEIDAPAETKRAMADAVARLVKAETDYAMARMGDDNDPEVRAARAERVRARAEVERLKVEFERLEQAANGDEDALREQIKREVREDVRASVREAVGS